MHKNQRIQIAFDFLYTQYAEQVISIFWVAQAQSMYNKIYLLKYGKFPQSHYRMQFY